MGPQTEDMAPAAVAASPALALADATAAEGDTAAEKDEREVGVGAAWCILSAPRVFLALTVVLALLFAWAQGVPQRPDPGELARQAPFAEAELLRQLGLDDVLVAWPVLLVGMLLVLVAVGLIVARARGRTAPGAFGTAFDLVVSAPVASLASRLSDAPHAGARWVIRRTERRTVARRGWATEATVTAVVGVSALVLALVIGRLNGLDARLVLDRADPAAPASISVRDGDLLIPRALPWSFRCDRPDPLDATRRVTCELSSSAAAPVETVTLAPGERTHTELGLVLEPRAEEPRPYSARGPLELVLRRGPGAPPERIMLSPGQAVALQASGHQLQMFPGPEGPLVLVTRAGDVPVLLGPPRVAQPPTQPGWPALELVPPTRQTIAARTEPERLLTILGVVFLVIGLLVHARVASVTVTMRVRGNATEVSIRSANAPEVAERVKARLSEAGKP